jgi:hypothetical protein
MPFVSKPEPIFVGEGYAEDFVVGSGVDGRYYASFTMGVEHEQYLCEAVSDTPDGPFDVHEKNIYRYPMRLGSIIDPCPFTNMTVRTYHNRLYTYDHRTIAFIDGNGNETPCNLPYPPDHDLFGRKDSFYVQPCCRLVNGVFFMVVNRVIRTPDRSLNTSVIDSFVSKDGVNFAPYRCPLIEPRPGTLFSQKIGNPYFYFEKDTIHVIAEGSNGCNGWQLFRFELRYRDMVTHEKALINDTDILANPSLEKFGDKYYLYYGKYDLKEKKYKTFVAVSDDLWTST